MKFIVKILWGMLGFCVSIAFKNTATHAASWVAGPWVYGHGGRCSAARELFYILWCMHIRQ